MSTAARGVPAHQIRHVIRDVMERRGLTRADLASAIGVHRSTVGRWLDPRRDVSIFALAAMTGALNLTAKVIVASPERLDAMLKRSEAVTREAAAIGRSVSSLCPGDLGKVIK